MLNPSLLRLVSMQTQPLAQATTLPATLYADPEIHARELNTLLVRHWQLAGNQLMLSGDLHFAPSQVLGKSVVLTRDRDQTIRAFHNVCRHRGGPLATSPGCSKTLQCKYHGWTYDLQGQCKVAGEMGEAEGFDRQSMRLYELPCRLWNGLIFVSLSPDPPPFENWLKDIDQIIEPISLANMFYAKRVCYQLSCNWKVYVENYLEGYHLPFVHPTLNQLLNFNAYTTQLHEWFSHQTSPIRQETSVYGSGHAHYFFLYPNMMLNILPHRLQTNLVIPMAANRCEVIFDYFLMDSDDAQSHSRLSEDLAFSEQVQQEDIEICEQVQKGLESGAYQHGRISPSQEKGLWHFQEHLRREYHQGLDFNAP